MSIEPVSLMTRGGSAVDKAQSQDLTPALGRCPAAGARHGADAGGRPLQGLVRWFASSSSDRASAPPGALPLVHDSHAVAMVDPARHGDFRIHPKVQRGFLHNAPQYPCVIG